MPLASTAAGTEAMGTPEWSTIRRMTTAMAEGDDEAFRNFHSAYFDRLLRYLFVVTRGDEQAARDALQETLLRVVRHVRPFDSEEVFWSWLTSLARSAAIDAGRKRAGYWRMLLRYASFRVKEPPIEVVADNSLDALLPIALQMLEPGERELIEAKYLGKSSVRELAARLGITEKAVESRLARARARLRKELSERLNHEEGS
jgi:RNA polymerase sigma-70 factor (ECF subfamily)